jgi:hypothetical protein
MFSGAWNCGCVNRSAVWSFGETALTPLDRSGAIEPPSVEASPQSRSAKPVEESVITSLLKDGGLQMKILYQDADHLVSGFETWVGNRVTCREVVHDLSLHRV